MDDPRLTPARGDIAASYLEGKIAAARFVDGETFEVMALRGALTVGDVDWEGDVMRALHRLNRTVRDPAQPETLEQWEARHREFHLTLIAGCRMPVPWASAASC